MRLLFRPPPFRHLVQSPLLPQQVPHMGEHSISFAILLMLMLMFGCRLRVYVCV
jgi:hypothetical protein